MFFSGSTIPNQEHVESGRVLEILCPTHGAIETLNIPVCYSGDFQGHIKCGGPADDAELLEISLDGDIVKYLGIKRFERLPS